MQDYVIPLCLGLGLAASCGFRVFVPALLSSVAAHFGWLELSAGFEWLATWPATIALAVAAVAEIAAYYVPWLDNALDTLATPLASLAGMLLLAATITEFDPMWRWSLAAIAGGGLAGSIKLSWSAIRFGSSTTTGGLGNFIVSTLEAIGSFFLAILALVLPILALLVVVILMVAVVRLARASGRFFWRPWRRGREVPLADETSIS